MPLPLKDVLFPLYIQVDKTGPKQKFHSKDYDLMFSAEHQVIGIKNRETSESAMVSLSGIVMHPLDEAEAEAENGESKRNAGESTPRA
jgi:hypothetical protein